MAPDETVKKLAQSSPTALQVHYSWSSMNYGTHTLQAAAQRLSGADRRRTLGVVIAVAGAISMSIGLVSQPAVADDSYVCPAGNYLSWTDTFDPPASVVVVPNFDIVYIGFGRASGGHSQVGDGTSMRGQTITVPGEPATDAHWCKAIVDNTTTTAAPTTTTIAPTTTTTIVETTTTAVETTTTTVVDTTTTTVAPTTTTTVAPTTTTIVDTTTTTEPEQTTTTAVETTTTQPTTTTTQPATTTTTTIPVTTTSSEIGGPTTTTTVPISPTTTTIPEATTTTVVEIFPPTTTITPTSVAAELPRTGTDSARAFMTFGALMMLMGGVLVLRSRRDYEFG